MAKKKNIVSEPELVGEGMDSDQLRTFIIDKMFLNLNKRMKNNTIYRLSDPNVPTRIKQVIPSGLPSFDLICARTKMGRSGLPSGRQIEVSSVHPSAGKTSLVCAFAAAAQRECGWMVKWCEGEGVFDPNRATQLGLDENNTLFSQSDCLEDLIDMIDETCDTIPEKSQLPKELRNFGCIVVVDSVASFPTRSELIGVADKSMKKPNKDGSPKRIMDQNNIGTFQRKMSQAQRRITSKLSKRNMIIIWINQSRDKINLGWAGRGPQTTTYGGNALRFHCAQRWQVRDVGKVKKGPKIVGIQMSIKNIKNKCGVFPFQETEVYLDFKNGFDYVDSWIQAMESLGLVKRVANSVLFTEGSWAKQKVMIKELRSSYNSGEYDVFLEYQKLMPKFIHNFVAVSKKKGNKDDSKEEAS